MKRVLVSVFYLSFATVGWAEEPAAPKPDAPAVADPQTEPAAEPLADSSDEAKPAAPAPPATKKPTPKAGKDCQVAVMNFQPKGLPADQQHVPELLADALAAEVASSTGCRVVTQADITQMLDFEATKASCGAMTESCLAEVGGALGVDRIIGGSVGQLGSSFKLQIKLQNVAEARVEKRVDRLIQGEPEALDLAARNAGRELFGLELLDESAFAVSQAPVTEPDDGSILPTIVLIGGGVVAALGVLGGIGAASGMMYFDQLVVGDATKPLQERQQGQTIGLALLGVTGAAAAVAVLGVGVAAVGLVLE